MSDLQSLSELYQNKLFRIPDYQRGYAWKQEQLVDFWDDILNLQDLDSFAARNCRHVVLHNPLLICIDLRYLDFHQWLHDRINYDIQAHTD